MVKLRLAPILFSLGLHRPARQHILESLKIAEDIRDSRLRTTASANLALFYWISGNLAAAVVADRTALILATANGDLDKQIASTIRMGMILSEAGRYNSSCRSLLSGMRLIPHDRRSERFGLLGIASVGSRAYLARSAAELGRFREAIQFGDESIELTELHPDPFSKAFAQIFTGFVLIRKDDCRRALPLLESGVTLCKRAKLDILLPLAKGCLGYARWQAGQRAAPAKQLLIEANEGALRQEQATRRSLILAWLAEVELAQRKISRARSHAIEAAMLAHKNKEHGHEAWALWTLGHVALNRAQGVEAVRHFTAGKRIADRRRMLPLSAHCGLGLSSAMLLRRSFAEAKRFASDAEATYKGIGLKRLADIARRTTLHGAIADRNRQEAGNDHHDVATP